MEYWEFLLQREGDRNWQPIRSKNQIEAGRYRVVAHSSRTNADVEICIIHQSTEEVPPKRRSQKRSRRTNPEGLMVVIPFTYLRSGLWELRCGGDIMSDFLGLSWQHSVQLVVLPKVTEVAFSELPSVLLTPGATENQGNSTENASFSSEPEITVEPISAETEAPQPILSVAHDSVESDNHKSVDPEYQDEASAALPDQVVEATLLTQPDVDQATDESIDSDRSDEEITAISAYSDHCVEANATPLTQPDVNQPNEISTNGQRPKPKNETFEELQRIQLLADSAISQELTEFDEDQTKIAAPLNETQANHALLADSIISQELAQFDEDQTTPDARTAQTSTSSNPILDQSLQMIEQILQQVLDPVMQEFEQSEPSEPKVISNSEQPKKIATKEPGLILTLDEESLVARRGESLTISGQVDILDVHQLNGGGETSQDLKTVFCGSLRYELRDPQNSLVLIEVEQPLPEQILPLAFSHSLEIPSDCKTRLILGKVTLYDEQGSLSGESTPVALASQPFTVTADLEELLGAIIPGTRAMPIAKMMVLANNIAPLPDSQDDSPEVLEVSEVSVEPVKQLVLDLVDVTQNNTLSLKPSTGNPLPPQIYQPTTSSKAAKSLQLPKFPKLPSFTEKLESSEELLVLEPASSPVLNFIEPEKVETKQVDSNEPLQQLVPDAELPPETMKTVVVESEEISTTVEEADAIAEDTEPEPHLQEAMQHLQEAISQIQSSVPLSSSEMDSDVSDSLVPLVESPDDGVLPKDESSDRNFINTNSFLAAPDTTESKDSTIPSEIEPSEDTDAARNGITSADFSEDDLNGNATQTPSIEVRDSDSLSEDIFDSSQVIEEELSESSSATESVAMDSAFQSLNLQDRFWLRLNSLATDTELSQSLKSDSSPPTHPTQEEDISASQNEQVGINVEEVTQPLTSSTLLTDFDASMWNQQSADFDEALMFSDIPEEIGDIEAEPLQLPPLEESSTSEAELLNDSSLVDIGEIDWVAREFVVDEEDEEPPAPEKPEAKPETAQTLTPAEPPISQPQPQREIISPRRLERPIPAPELSIPTNELAAGEPVTVRVKLPPHSARLCVKLWVQDRQSRSLLDGPRWLMDMIPDRTGEQEALTQLTVPFGSVEIRFEAIAVDIDSQRESHKVSVDCVVVPPDLLNFSLDDFEA